jgi:hypothetical protein
MRPSVGTLERALARWEPLCPTPRGLHPSAGAVYLRRMERRNPGEHRVPLFDSKGLLGFRPWMLALAVFLACAIGVVVMEQRRDARAMWAHAQIAEDGPAR